MQLDVEERYQRALTELGGHKAWYQTASDLFFAAVVATVDDLDGEEILARGTSLADLLPATHPLHYIHYSVAAVSAARGIDIEPLVANSDAVSDLLRPATRSTRARGIAGAIIAVGGQSGLEVRANQVVALYQAWNSHHRFLTNSGDLVLSAITESAQVDPVTALDRANDALDQLANRGYRDEWEVARILALDAPASTVSRFLGLSHALRGRRRKPLTDRRSSIALTAAADHPLPELVELVPQRLRAVRAGRFRPDKTTGLTLAALLTLGGSVPSGHRLHTAFHAAVLSAHYRTSVREADAS